MARHGPSPVPMPPAGDDDSLDAFESWYRSYAPGLKAWCGRMLDDDAAAQDVVQETLLRAWTRRDAFTEPAQVGPWLWCVARNLCLDNLRRRKRLVVSDSLPESVDERADPTLHLEIEQERAAVRDAMGELSRRHQEALLLRDVRGLEYEELASRLGVTPTGARAVLFRARRSLRNALSASDAFGAFVPAGLARRIVDSVRNGGGTLAARWSGRPSLAMEMAAATLAAATVLGPATSAPEVRAPGPAANVAGPSAAASLDDVASVLAAAQVSVQEAVSSTGTPDTSAPVAQAPPIEPRRWEASLTVGQRRGDPGSELVGAEIGFDTADTRSPLAKLASRLPSIDLSVLQRQAPASPPPAP